MYTCEICLKEFQNVEDFEKHKKMKRKCGYICEYCKCFYEKYKDLSNHKCYIKNKEIFKMLPQNDLDILQKYNTDIYYLLNGNTDFDLSPNIVKIKGGESNIKLIGGNFHVISNVKHIICQDVDILLVNCADKISGTINSVIGKVKVFENCNVKTYLYNFYSDDPKIINSKINTRIQTRNMHFNNKLKYR